MKPIERDPAVDRLMRSLEPPAPPPDLRSRALAAARNSVADATTSDVWSTIWNNRGIRLAWVGAAAVLLAGHVFLVPANGAVSNRVDPSLVAEHRVDEYLFAMLRPVQISKDVQPILGLIAGANGLTELDLEGNP
jgi:hypothetical protein